MTDANSAGHALDPLAEQPLDCTLKGLSPAFDGLLARDAHLAGVQLFDDTLLFPAAVLKESVLRANGAWMRRFTLAAGVQLAPHGKTTMAPALFQRQLDDGAWGMTAATLHHVRAYRRFGVSRIIMANQLVGEGEIGWIEDELALDPGFQFYALADSVSGVEQVAQVAARRGARRPINLLVEAGRVGGRTGVRSLEEGLTVAGAIAAAGLAVRLAGVETYEGVSQSAPDGLERAEDMLSLAVRLAAAIESEGLLGEEVLLTAGGSSYFDLAAAALNEVGLGRATRVLRSGCYLTHDDGLYQAHLAAMRDRSPEVAALVGELRPALQVWAHVLSRPEPGRIVCGAGKRDLGADAHPPRVMAWARPGDRDARHAPDGLTTAALYDQHVIIDGQRDMPFAVGDLVGFGVSHPCTTFDKWRALVVVDDAWRVREVVRTYF